MTYHRSAEEQLKYLEAQLLSGDGHRCEECGDVRHVNDMSREYEFKLCDECAGYQAVIDREEREYREEMKEDGTKYKQ